MATKHDMYTLGSSTAVRLTPPGIHTGMDITLQNVNDSGFIYVGDENVSPTNYGFRIIPGAAISWTLPGLDTLYVIGSTTNLKLAVMKVGPGVSL